MILQSQPLGLVPQHEGLIAISILHGVGVVISHRTMSRCCTPVPMSPLSEQPYNTLENLLDLELAQNDLYCVEEITTYTGFSLQQSYGGV
jgi:hypothetical protein